MTLKMHISLFGIILQSSKRVVKYDLLEKDT